MSTQEITVIPAEAEVQRFMPVMSMTLAIERRQVIVEAVQKLMKDGQDFGVIPGTPRPTLYQPGADKLCNLFGLVPTFSTIEQVQDWTGEQHGGEPFFYYAVKCQLYRGQHLMGEGEGSCNSWEGKYRWRKTERVCPACGSASIIKGKEQYGGGWLCFAKKGGCGAKYKDGDQAIESQVTGNKPNPDIYDLVNTVLKMANKRAKIAATLNATSAHEFFTQDVEDISGIDTGGHAVGTQAAADHVRDGKIAADRAQGTSGRTGNPIELREATRPDAGGGGVSPSAAPVDIPDPEIAMFWKRAGSSRKKMKEVCEELHRDFIELMGGAGDFAYREQLGVSTPDAFAEVRQFRACVKRMVEYLRNLKTAAEAANPYAPSLPEPAYVATDDDVPSFDFAQTEAVPSGN